METSFSDSGLNREAKRAGGRAYMVRRPKTRGEPKYPFTKGASGEEKDEIEIN